MNNNRLPMDFPTVIDEIRLPVIEGGAVYGSRNTSELLLDLVQYVVMYSQFLDVHGNVLVPNAVHYNGITRDISSSLVIDSMSSIQTQLFTTEAPIVGLCEAYMKFVYDRDIDIDKDCVLTHSTNVDWGDVSVGLLNSAILMLNGAAMNDRIAYVQTMIDGPPHPSGTISLLGKNSHSIFEDVVLKWLSRIFDFSERGVARVHNSEALKIPMGSAQNTAIPFVWNNCNQGCRFCYVDRGFSTIRYPRGWSRSLDDVRHVLKTYDYNTRRGHPSMRYALMDWEPTVHPQFIDVLKEICAADPSAQVPILTHGGNLSERLLRAVAADDLLHRQVVFQVSLNSADPARRKLLMPGGSLEQHETAIRSLPLMHDLGIKFDVSIVGATHWVPHDDIENTIRYADQYDPMSYIRVALPAGTMHHNPKLLLSPDELAGVDAFVCALRPEIRAPIIVTVGLLNRRELMPTIEEIVCDSNADKAGIKAGSDVLSVNGVVPRSRTEAMQLMSDFSVSRMFVTVREMDGEIKEVDLTKYKSSKEARTLVDKKIGTWGILMHDDVDFSIFRRIAEYQTRYHLKKPVMITSMIMKKFMDAARTMLYPVEEVDNLQIIATPNKHFGGNICIAGLLTHDDIARAVEEQKVDGDGFFISSAMLSKGGYDLAGVHTSDLRARLKKPVFPLVSYTSAL